MITWNPNDKHINCVLSNNNLTAYCKNSGYPAVRCTEPKTVGKWYFEFTYEQLYNNGFGICTKDFSFGSWLGGNSGSYVYFGHRGEWWSGGSNKSATQAVMNVGDTLGVLLDCDNKTLQSVVNGKLQDDKINYNLNGEIYVVFGKVAESNGNVGGTVNFGKYRFNLDLRNNELWNDLVSKGYKPYDKNNFYTRFLLKQNNQYYTIKSQFYDVSTNKYLPCEKDYEVNGFEDLSELIKEVNIDNKTFRPIDKFDKTKQLEILKYQPK